MMADPVSVCLVTFLLFQDAPMSLDWKEHLKNSLNQQEVTLPYDCGQFEKLPVGRDMASGSLNFGSLVIRNSVKVFHFKVIRKRKVVVK